MKKIILKDGGKDKTFIIHKAKGMAAFELFMDINRVIERAEGTFALIAQQFMHNCMQTGTKVNGVSNSEVEKAINEHSNELIHFIFNSFFKELDKNTRNDILDQIFKHIIFLNGEYETKISATGTTQAEHIDQYVDEVTTIFSICREFMGYNFGHFLPQKAPPSSPGNLLEG